MDCPNEMCMSPNVRALGDGERSRVDPFPPKVDDVELNTVMICEDCGGVFVEGRAFDVFPLLVLLGQLKSTEETLSPAKA